jgi:clan AA aspartic protease
MITGTINASLDAVIPLTLVAADGQQHSINAILDSGFGGYLALPTSQIASLGWPWLNMVRAQLADGNVYWLEVHEGTVLWEGQLRQIDVQALDSHPLIGMRLLHHHTVKMDVVVGGLVTIEPRAVP